MFLKYKILKKIQTSGKQISLDNTWHNPKFSRLFCKGIVWQYRKFDGCKNVTVRLIVGHTVTFWFHSTCNLIKQEVLGKIYDAYFPSNDLHYT
jgi:hypothetical protein